MYKINKSEELTTLKVAKIIQAFRFNEQPKLQRYYDYYLGNQDILKKEYADSSKPISKVVKNYCYSIVNNYNGYITGIPITYSSDDDIASLMDIFNYNDYENEDSLWLRNALIFGIGYELCYIDEEKKERFKALDPREVIPVYDDTLEQNLLYVIRFYEIPSYEPTTRSSDYRVEVYSDIGISIYRSDATFTSFTLLEQYPHYFQQVPISEFPLNDERASIFDKVMGLQNAYNELLSSEISDFSSFVDAYLVLKGTGIAEEDLPLMRENRVLVMDAEDSAEYLTKNINDTQIENMLQNINDSIHVISNSPDFNDEKFLAQSGIAMRYKLVGFENTSASIVANMIKAIQKRIELLYAVMGVISGDAFADVKIHFTRNLPQDDTAILSLVNSLRGLVSDRTLLSMIPYIEDPDAELQAIQEQKATYINMYSFGNEDE